MPEVTIRYWAAAKEAAGTDRESVAAGTLAEAIDAVLASRAAGGRGGDGRLREVLARSSFLIDGTRASRAAADVITLSEGSVVEVLPPFAGG
jgi:molybdopterin converting factor small subunit